MPVGEAMRIEREHLLPLTAEGFELAETSFPTVDGKGCVKVRTNFYSTPLKPGTRAQAKLLPAYVEIWQERECVARHERSFGRYEQVLDLEHYLDVLEKKPGALAGSSPLRQWRERGRWPESFDRLWQSLQERHGKHPGTREMIELLTLGKRHGWERLQQAVEKALALGCTDAAAVRHLADGNGTGSSAHRVTRTEWAGTLRAAVAADERVRPVTRHRCHRGGGGAMKEQTQALEHASVKQYCKALRVPMIGAHFVQLAEQAVKETAQPHRLSGSAADDGERKNATGTPFSNGCTMPSCRG